MNARLKTTATDHAIAHTIEGINMADTAASWANDRLLPMVQALAALAQFSSDQAHKSNERLALIRSLAMETEFMLGDVTDIFEGERDQLEKKLAALKGGAA